MGEADLRTRQRLASKALLAGGITFSVYSDQRGSERVFPFDVIPRLVSSSDWSHLQAGLEQRSRALDLFLADVYGDQRILNEKPVLRQIVETSAGFLPKMRGIRPNGGVHVHIAGIDLIRDQDGTFLVLEDNLRTPSGVSYVLENRAVMKRVLGPVLANVDVESVDEYPTRLREILSSVAPEGAEQPRVVILTPGPYNSAYFEHSFLARRMGCDLVYPSDLFVQDDRVFMKTTAGPLPVDVIYRRVDDEFIDPRCFRDDSLLGIPGIVDVYAKGRVTLANALGNGVADDKAVYPFVPDIIRFYLSEEPILKQVDTLLCGREADRKRVLDNLSSMVVKQVDASGGYGMLMGHKASRQELADYALKIQESPRNYIAQP
ncbi:MAG: circularly permuted type 2 ATP-grasp protein, partial [Myxococcales bacterium]|nr:circularly permuted type 2 ATP-grasp protein [Myxococcales bacterium]